MKDDDVFRREMSPALTLLDVAGRRHRIASLDDAARAIRIADELHGLSGAGRVTGIGGDFRRMHEAEAFLLYYRSHALQASSREIARVARVLARSEAVVQNARGDVVKVTGSRAVAYADRANPNEGRVCFLVSQLVWYNCNRAMLYPPSQRTRDERTDKPFHETVPREFLGMFLRDANDRLAEGVVSFPL
ncbi:hypothetical protein [Paracoccus sp. ME4]|uniref:hypothetical protein n=1 Tax=Paracoccus sp. ME4 TaxID=3138066 RepID=UPI00398B5A09